MSYYIMSDRGELIERQDDRPSDNALRECAEECECDVWVIEGERVGGYDLNPHHEIPLEQSRVKPAPKPRLVFGQPIPPELNPHAQQSRFKGP